MEETMHWKNLPMLYSNGVEVNGRDLTPEEMMTGLVSIIQEWMQQGERDESVRHAELPLIQRIEAGVKAGAFGDETDLLKRALEVFSAWNDDERASQIVARITGKSREQLCSGSGAARQVLNEIKRYVPPAK